MAAASVVPSQVSVEEYLRSSYEPDVDYVDGVLEERVLGEFDHSWLQRELLFAIGNISASLRSRLFPEMRVQVAPSRFRVPDLCVLADGHTERQIIRQAPILCCEILSPEDRMSRVLARARDFFAMGVPEIWIFDPEERKVYRLLPGSRLEEVTGRLQSLSGEVAIELDPLFRKD